MQLFLKILSGMANSVDPDQTAPSDLGLHCLHIPICQKLMCTNYFDIYHSHNSILLICAEVLRPVMARSTHWGHVERVQFT